MTQTGVTCYKNVDIVRTDATSLDSKRRLYAFTGAVIKSATARPHITSLRAAREYVDSRVG